MSVYVDPVREYGGSKTFRWTRSCHLYADSLEELHSMAQQIGLKRAWFQDKPGFPHYDLVATKRAMAVERGAMEHTHEQTVQWKRLRMGAEMSLSLFEVPRGEECRHEEGR